MCCKIYYCSHVVARWRLNIGKYNLVTPARISCVLHYRNEVDLERPNEAVLGTLTGSKIW